MDAGGRSGLDSPWVTYDSIHLRCITRAVITNRLPFAFMRASSIFESLIASRKPQSADAAVRTELTTLTPSMLADLQRFERHGRHTEVVEVMAASVRHSRSLSLKLEIGGERWPLMVLPRQRIVHGPMDLQQLDDTALRSIKVVQVEPVGARSMIRGQPDRPREKYISRPLGPLLWHLALHGARSELLPEISGPVAYRLSAGLSLDGLQIGPDIKPILHRLRGRAARIEEFCSAGPAGRERTQRLLNALYLQSGLIISRSRQEPAKFSLRRWFGA